MGDAAPLPQDDPKYVAPQGDPHTDDVLEGGPADPPEVLDPPAGETPSEPETPTTPAVVDQDGIPPAVTAKSDWRDIDRSKLRDKLRTEREQRAEVEAENQRLRDLTESLSRQDPPEPAEGEQPAPARRQPPAERVYTQAEMDAEADRRADVKARSIAQQTVFQSDFASAVAAANKTYGAPKVQDAINRISELGGLDVDHLNMILATDDPGKVIFDLGSKPEEFQRIMELPFNKRVVEFTKMGLKTETPARQPSKTPPPVEPIGGGGGSTDNRYDDKASDDAWFAAEEKRSAAYHKNKRGY